MTNNYLIPTSRPVAISGMSECAGSDINVILDFQKVFGKVPHQRLLLKLKAHGIVGGIISWVEQWLTDRRQRVLVDGEVSNLKSVFSGVPQGSVWVPLLF